MFDYIVVRRTGLSTDMIDIGMLAETMLFYQKIHILIDQSTLAYLVRKLGDNLITLLDMPYISASFQRNFVMNMTNKLNGLALHNFGIATVNGDQKRPNLNDNDYIKLITQRAVGKSSSSERLARNLSKRLSSAPLPESPGAENFLAAAANDLNDHAFVREAIQSLIGAAAHGLQLPTGWFFRPHFIGTEVGGQPQFVVETNLNFESLNIIYHQYIPPTHSSLSASYLLSLLLSAREATYVSSKHMAEIVIDPATASVMRLKYLDLMRKRDKQVVEADLFQDMVVPNARKLREIINSGERTFDNFLRLMDHASKFKSFLATQNPDKALLDAYYAEVTKESWLDKLGTKTTRFGITTGLGFAAEALFPTGGTGTLIGLGVGAFDAVALDKILKGWRPNQFIDDKFAPFVSGR